MTEKMFSRAATLEDLKSLLQALNDHGVRYCLIGGYALLTQGYARATTDIDLLVPASRENAVKLQQALLLLPDQAARDLSLNWLSEGETENVRLNDAFTVDLMLNAGGETFESLSPLMTTTQLDGISVTTLTLEGLLRTKQGTRDKDVMDRLVLERAIQAIKTR